MRPVAALLAACAVVTSTVAAADAPSAPAPPTVCSLSGRVCATRDAVRGSVLIWRKAERTRRVALWSVATRGPNLQVADDGKSVVEIYPGSNLLSVDAGPSTTVLTFHRPGKSPVRISLASVVGDPAALPRTVSHRQWASSYGYDGRGRYLLETADHRRWTFDPATGAASRR